jgi:hypothetical protein
MKSEQVKRGCAIDLLENARSFIQLRGLENRLAALENAISNAQEGDGSHDA